MIPEPDLDALARELLGLTALRPAQRKAIEAVVAGRDVLAVLPTGSGKSAIYQVAGLARGGTTVVVSPLVALQHDQVRSLTGRRKPDGRLLQVAAVNASTSAGDHREAVRRWRDGELDVVLVGPEQLENPTTREALRTSSRPVTLLAVDEAHLVSEWGHEFRPDYLHLGGVIDDLGGPPVLALTATAAPPVRADIVRELRMTDPELVVSGFDRPNIELSVHVVHPRGNVAEVNEAVEDAAVTATLALSTPALVYASSHAACERLAARLRQSALAAQPYHAGLPVAERTSTQDAFLAGRLDVVVATSAFGMGIDKPDVRVVVHAGPPGSLDEYYQEIGRAGRDGAPAHALLVFAERALQLPKLFATRSRLGDADVRRVVDALLAVSGAVEPGALAQSSGVARHTTERIVDELAEAALVRVSPDGVVVPPDARSLLAAEGVEDVETAVHRREQVADSRIDAVRHYAETTHCRRVELLGYFGEEFAGPCGNCDNDAHPHPATPPVPAVVSKDSFQVHAGTLVRHPSWGVGTVMSVDDHELVVAFDSVGYKTLTTVVLRNGLLRPA
ncbi:RecQ family ATP-dependent DNA helicase [Jatrophihabitans sp. YIM 134969]